MSDIRSTPASTGVTTPSRAAGATPRIDYLDGVRAAAAMYVVVHHIWHHTWRSFPENDGPVWLGWLVYGHVAVSVFIVVSGFSLALGPVRRGWQLGSARRFLARRAWRIIPTYYAAILLTGMVFGVLTTERADTVTLRSIVVHALLLQDVVDSPKPNGAFWSIAVEWQIYFLFPLLLLAMRRVGAWQAVLSVAVLVIIVRSVAVASDVYLIRKILDVSPQYIALFAFGVLAAGALADPRRWHQRLMWVAAGVVGVIVGAAATLGSVWVVRHYFWIDLLVGVAAACLFAGMAAGGGQLLRRLLASRLLKWLGSFAFSIYLVHIPVLWLVARWVADPLGVTGTERFLLLVVAATPLVVAVSCAFSILFERPFLTRRSWAEVRPWLLRRVTVPPSPRSEVTSP